MRRIATYLKNILILTFLLWTGSVFSQPLADTLQLREVEIRGNFAVRNDGFKKIRIDSGVLVQYLSSDLSTLLSQHSTVFVKSYGNGSLSTPSFRGTSANHTQVEWNGININSPMLGQTDLSQVPVSQFETLEILYGAATVARTSGAFGGIINLVSNPSWDNKLNITLAQTLASFSNYTTTGNIAAGNGFVQSITKFNYSNAQNDFPYNNDYTQTRENQVNAKYILGGFTQEMFFRLSGKDVLSARFWFSDNYHQIPPTTSTSEDVHKEEEIDKCIRSMIDWRRSASTYSISIRSSLVDQFMQFTQRDQSWNHHSYTWSNLAKFSYTGISNLIIRPGLNYNYDWVVSDSYNGLKSRENIGAYTELIYNAVKRLHFSLVLRQDVIDKKFLPFIPALGIEYKPFHTVNLAISANACRNYRYPDLNDLYFEPYGNPELKPETDYAVETGLVYNTGNKDDRFFLEVDLTGYYSKMVNYILWQPTASGNFTPNNIAEVHARGLESGINLSGNFGKVRIGFANTYNYCLSSNEVATFPGDQSVGNQLIYTPEHMLNSSLPVNFHGFFVTPSVSFISKRYVSPDNSSFMPSYYLFNIFLGKDFHFNKYALSLQLNLNNLFDLDYQSVVDRPMPGRNYALTLKFNFRK